LGAHKNFKIQTGIIVAKNRRDLAVKNKKRRLRKDWMLGFLGLMSFMGLRYFQSGEWLYLIWFIWVLWLPWFIPLKTD
jgi:hypothetical protein